MLCGLWDTFRKFGVLVGIRSQRQIMDPTSRDHTMQITMQGLFNEYDWFVRAENVRVGVRRSASRGRWPTAVPLGFRREKGLLIPDHGSVAILTPQIEAVGTLSLREASRYLAERNILVSPSTLHHRAHNPLYEGVSRYGGRKMEFVPNPEARYGDNLVPKLKRQPAEAEVIVIKDAFPRPVPDELVEASRAALQARRHNRNGWGIRRRHGPSFFLVGLLYCGLCGLRFQRHVVKHLLKSGQVKIYDYLGCDPREYPRIGRPKHDCPNRRLLRAVVEWRFEAGLRADLREENIIRVLLEKSIRRRCRLAEEERPDRVAKRARLKGEKDRLETTYGHRIAEDAAFAKAYEMVCKQLEAMEGWLAQADQLQRRLETYPRFEAEFIVRLSDLTSRWGKLALNDRAVLLRHALTKVVVGESLRMTLVPRRTTPDQNNVSVGAVSP